MSKLTAPLDRFSDWLERKLPWWLTYNGIGDPISWSVDHPAWTLVASAVGSLFGHGVLMAWVAVAIYCAREAVWDGPYHLGLLGWANAWRIQRDDRNPWCSGFQVGWLTDGINDALCTAVVALMVTLWGLGVAAVATFAHAVVAVGVLRYLLRNTPRRVP